jgi:hypothetical protein
MLRAGHGSIYRIGYNGRSCISKRLNKMWTINDGGNLLKCADCGRHEPEHTATVETSPVLRFVESFTDFHKLLHLYENRIKDLLTSRGVKFDWYGNLEDDPDIWITQMDENGFTVKTVYTSCGDTDTDYTHFPLSDLDVNVEELNRRVAERKAKERAEAEARDRALKARQQAIADERDRNEYARLKQKFGDA